VPRGVSAPHRPETIGAVDRLAAGRAERDSRLVAAVRAGRGEHLAGTAVASGAVATVASAIPTCAVAAAGGVPATGAVAVAARAVARAARPASSLAAGSTGRAAAWLGEATLRVKVLLRRGEDELLSAIRASQILVAVQKELLSVARRRSRARVLASAVRGVRFVVVYAYAATDRAVTLGDRSIQAMQFAA